MSAMERFAERHRIARYLESDLYKRIELEHPSRVVMVSPLHWRVEFGDNEAGDGTHVSIFWPNGRLYASTERGDDTFLHAHLP
jgi:hypothetical protein